MRLTRYTDYAMRVLLYLGARQDRLCSIAEIAQAYGISQNHLMKVVSDLVSAGYLVSVGDADRRFSESVSTAALQQGAVLRPLG